MMVTQQKCPYIPHILFRREDSNCYSKFCPDFLCYRHMTEPMTKLSRNSKYLINTAYFHLPINIHTHTHTHTHTCAFIHTHTCTHTITHTHTHTYTYKCVCTYICTYTYICYVFHGSRI